MSEQGNQKGTVIITGTSQGLGLLLANDFFAKGWNVIATGRSPKADGLDPNIQYFQFDASNFSQTAEFWNNLNIENRGNINLINNAGGYAGGKFLETEPEAYEKMIHSNYFAAVNMTRGFIGNFSEGRIVNVISANALSPRPTDSAYGASKAAQMYFFKSLQQEFKSEPYQITNLYPDSMATSGPNPNAIEPADILAFIIGLLDSEKTFYLSDVSLNTIRRS